MLPLHNPEPSFLGKIARIPYFLVLLISILAGMGIAVLYSIAGQQWQPWALNHAIRFGLGMGVFVVVALLPLHFWLRAAYPLYFLALLALIAVELVGVVGMGAQRWIDLGIIRLQPSEIMKITLVLALARYFHGATLEEPKRLLFVMPALFLIVVPTAFVLLQPDLGTALLLVAGGAVVLIAVGVPLWWFAGGFLAALAALPIVWKFGLHPYQKQRILTFINPETDPLGAGYHISQSKIALGSGGFSGRGYAQGTQSQLNFIPEKHTDFVFAVWAEEFGFIGSLGLLFLLALILLTGYRIALLCNNQFGRIVAIGVLATFFLYIFINIGMVIGLLPVVGVPLPLVSYGGTAILTIMTGFGLLASVAIHRDQRLSRGIF